MCVRMGRRVLVWLPGRESWEVVCDSCGSSVFLMANTGVKMAWCWCLPARPWRDQLPFCPFPGPFEGLWQINHFPVLRLPNSFPSLDPPASYTPTVSSFSPSWKWHFSLHPDESRQNLIILPESDHFSRADFIWNILLYFVTKSESFVCLFVCLFMWDRVLCSLSWPQSNLAVQLRLASNSRSSCHHSLNAVTIGVCHQTQLSA